MFCKRYIYIHYTYIYEQKSHNLAAEFHYWWTGYHFWCKGETSEEFQHCKSLIIKMPSISIICPFPNSLTESLNITLRMSRHHKQKTLNQCLQSIMLLAFSICHPFQPLPPSTLTSCSWYRLNPQPFPLPPQPAMLKDTSFYSPFHFWHSSSAIPLNP